MAQKLLKANSEGEFREVDVDEVEAGDILLVKPGKGSVDGTV